VEYFQFLVSLDNITHPARVPFAALTLVLCFYYFILVIRSRNHLSEEKTKKYVPWLIIAVAIAFFLRILIYPHHAGLMNDDYYHIQCAKRILYPSFVSVNHVDKSIGWPFILSILFWFTGLNDFVLFYANSIIGCLSVIVIFYLVTRVVDSVPAGIAAAMFLAVHPLHSIWSTCGENNIVAVFFMLFSLFALYGFFRFHFAHYVYLSLFAASYAAQIRAEHFLLFIFMPFGMWMIEKEVYDIKKFARGCVFPILLAAPNVIYELASKTSINWTASDSGGVLTGQNASADNLISNLAAEFARITHIGNYSFALLVFAAFGLALGWKKENRNIIFFGLIGATYFILISTLWKTLACRERFFLYTDVCLIVIGSIFVKEIVERVSRFRIHMLALCIIVPIAISYKAHINNIDPRNSYFFYGKNATEAIARTQKYLPPNSILIIQDPSPFQAVSDITVIMPDFAVQNAARLKTLNNLYYFMDISSINTPREFFGVFKFEKVFSMAASPLIPAEKSAYGLYKVTTIGAETVQDAKPSSK
jgi:hypothetical protein